MLAGFPGALHVQLDGQAGARAARAAREQGLDQAAAWEQLRQTDRARTAYVRHLYGRDPADSGLYDLVIDSTAVLLESCVEAITAAAGQSAHRPAAPGRGGAPGTTSLRHGDGKR